MKKVLAKNRLFDYPLGMSNTASDTTAAPEFANYCGEPVNQLNPNWVAVGPANENADEPLAIGDKIIDGDYFMCDGKRFPATDTGSGLMSKSHYPHFRPNADGDARRETHPNQLDG